MALPITCTSSSENSPLGNLEITLILGVPSYTFVNEISVIVTRALFMIKLPAISFVKLL